MENEIWKDIPNWENQYQISNLGNVRKIKKIKITVKKGYYPQLSLFKDGDKIKSRKYLNIHRVMALLFIPNPENKAVVNHKNGDKTDFSIANLEWMTSKENSQHCWDTGLATPWIMKGKKSPSYKHGKFTNITTIQKCPTCEKSFSLVNQRPRTCCSQKCSSILGHRNSQKKDNYKVRYYKSWETRKNKSETFNVILPLPGEQLTID